MIQNTAIVKIFWNKFIVINNLYSEKEKEIQKILESKGAKVVIEEDEPQSYIVRGSVIQSNNIPLPNIIIPAFDWDSQGEELLGEKITDAKGNYQITYTTEKFSRFETEGSGPDLIVRAYNPQGEILASSPRKNNAQVQETVDLTIAISQEDIFIVQGTIRQADGSKFVGVTVRAFDRVLRREELLGQTQTNKEGFYKIQYSPLRFRKQEKGNADLIVKVLNPNNLILATSPILFNAPPIAEIDLTIPAEIQQPPSLFEKIAQVLEPLLEGLPLTEIEENEQHQDITFLSGETGFTGELLARFALAHKLAQQAIQPEFWFVLLDSSFYQYNQNESLESPL